MADSPLHSAADTFVAAPSYDTVVVGMRKGPRRILRVLGVLMALVLPVLSMHYDPYGFDVTCEASTRQCTIVEHHFAREVVTTVAFDDVRLVQGHAEHSSNENDHTPTGRIWLTFEMHDGRSIDASLNAWPEDLHADGLRAFMKAPSTAVFEVHTFTTWQDQSGILVFFIIGLWMLAVTFWRTEVALDAGTQVLWVSRRLWPLMRRTVLRVPVDDVKHVRGESGDIHTVWVKLNNGEDVRIARSVSTMVTDDIVAAIRDKVR